MISQFKIWAAAHIQENWNMGLENFVLSKSPKTHHELELAIQEFQSKSGE